MNGIQAYKKPRPSKEVMEDLSQRYARYLRIARENHEVFSKDPTARDKAEVDIRASQAAQGHQAGMSPYEVVPFGADPDEYLAKMDAALKDQYAKEEVTIHDNLLRWHYAMSALMVFNEYKIQLPYIDFHTVCNEITHRGHQIHREWARATYGAPAPKQSGPHAPPPTVPAPQSSSSRNRLNTDDIEDFLETPQRFMDMRFKSTFVNGQSSIWELDSFVCRRSGVEFSIKLEDTATPFVMDVAEMRSLLAESELDDA